MKFSLVIGLLLFSLSGHAQEEGEPSFYLGDGTSKWGVVVTDESQPFELRLGTRLQSILLVQESEDEVTGKKANFQDFYLRKARLMMEAKYKESFRFYMDVRNDKANIDDKGESDFSIGDAYVEVKDLFGSSFLKLRAFRTKVDVSRAESVSSSSILYIDGPKVSGEAAQFVSESRRATNLQILGNFHDRVVFQLAAGDGVGGSKFYDAKGSSLGSGKIYRQNFMFGGKLKISPFAGWEDPKPKETYFGKGKHFTIGYGAFHTGAIQFENSGGTEDEISRTLMNGEFSAHYKNLSLQAEYYRFNGVIENLGAASFNKGDGEGFYVHGEYVFPNLSYIAPYVRYESWDKFKQADEYDFTSYVAGANWYLKGNKIRVGAFYESQDYGKNAVKADARGHSMTKNQLVKIVSMWNY